MGRTTKDRDSRLLSRKAEGMELAREYGPFMRNALIKVR